MFHSIDLLIGFATVMAALSLVITVLTQVVADLFQLRTRHLRQGMTAVLGHAGIELEEARRILEVSRLWNRTEVTASELSTIAASPDFQNVFDAEMRKASAQFTLSSRIIVVVLSVLVAVGLPLDTLDLFRTFSSGQGALLFPNNFVEWMLRWDQVNIAGVAASAVLLSLGAPFWFEILKDLLNLKGTSAK
jgi:hypothetical protein